MYVDFQTVSFGAIRTPVMLHTQVHCTDFFSLAFLYLVRYKMYVVVGKWTIIL